MGKLYGIYHEYDVDEGYGHTIYCNDLIFICESKEVADEYVSKWSNERVYSEPYDKLMFGKLIVEELPMEITKNNLNDSPESLLPHKFKHFLEEIEYFLEEMEWNKERGRI